MTVVSGALAGVLLLVLGFWAGYAVARLWQVSLYEEAEPAIAAAVARGLVVRPTGFAARIVCEGSFGDQKVRVEWRGGAFGARTIVVRGGKRTRVELVRDGAALEAALEQPWKNPPDVVPLPPPRVSGGEVPRSGGGGDA